MGKSSPPPPDYGPLADASKEAAEIASALGEKQLAFAGRQYEETKPYLQAIANQQLGAATEQQAQAVDYYGYNVDTFRPVEQGLVTSAREYNTQTYQQQLAQRAAADAGLAFTQTEQATQRAMASMGVNPNSARFQTTQRANQNGLAAQRAGAMTNARLGAEQLGYARQLDVVGVGRGLPGASSAAYAGALNAGNSAGQNYQTPGQSYAGNQALGAGTIVQGQQQRLGGLGQILNAQTSAYINGGQSSGIGSALGGVAGIAGAVVPLFTGSDRRLKENIECVGTDNHTGLTLYEFNYTADPDRRYRGVMADEVEIRFPEAVRTEPNGMKSVHYSALGITMQEVR